MSAIRSLLGRTAIVTGASSGNGRAISLALARAGANVVCSDLSPLPRSSGYEVHADVPTHELIAKKLAAASPPSDASPNGALFQACDVAKPHEVKSLVAAAVSQFGRLDIMVNNAGICTRVCDILEETDEDYERTIAINVTGVYYGCKYAIGQFVSQDPLPPGASAFEGESGELDPEPETPLGDTNQPTASIGKIVNISSIGGMVGLRGEAAYCASKGAVLNLTRQLALDFGPRRVNVNALCPGYLATAMVRPMISDPEFNKFLRDNHPWPRLGKAGDVASAARWLCGPESDWVTGAAVPVDGGYTAR